MWGYSGWRLSGAAVAWPLGLLALWFLWPYLVALGALLYVGLVVFAFLKWGWEETPWHRRRADRERRVSSELRALRAERFERLHGVPMPAGYGYYSQVTPGHDARAVRLR